MFEKLRAKWKVNGVQFFLIMCTFAVTGTLTAYISRYITGWVGFSDQTFWLWKFLLRLVVLVFGYQVIILVVSFFFGQFPFFWAYEKKILRWFGGSKSQKPKVKSQNDS
jgi:ABC-type multidrug transport system permease subunit